MDSILDSRVLYAPFDYDDALILFSVLGTSDIAKKILHALVDFPETSITEISALIRAAATETKSQAFGLVTYLISMDFPSEERFLKVPYRFQDVVACLSHLDRSQKTKRVLHLSIEHVVSAGKILAAIADLPPLEKIKAVALERRLLEDTKPKPKSVLSATSYSPPVTPSLKRKRSQEKKSKRTDGLDMISNGTSRIAKAAWTSQNLENSQNLSPKAFRIHADNPDHSRFQVPTRGDTVENKMSNANDTLAASVPDLLQSQTVKAKPRMVLRGPSTSVEALNASAAQPTSSTNPLAADDSSSKGGKEQLRKQTKGKEKLLIPSTTYEKDAQASGRTKARRGRRQRSIGKQSAADLLAAVG